MALRGVNFLTAMSVLTELGDISRFESPRQLMGYLGLVPSEHSSGGKAKRGGITKTGNGRVRRLLVETAWFYRFPARRSHHLQQKAEKATKEAQSIGVWRQIGLSQSNSRWLSQFAAWTTGVQSPARE